MKRKQFMAGVLALQCMVGGCMIVPTYGATENKTPITESKTQASQQQKTVLNRENIYQVSDLNALMLGYYDGVVTVEELLKNGDTGIGTFDTLDGEMIVLDGNVYKAKSDGTVEKQGPEVKIPFGAVTYFDKDLEIKDLKGVSNIEDIKKTLDEAIKKNNDNKNIFYVATIKGDFNLAHVRSVPAQKKPYKPLSEIAATQPEFNYKDISGTIVALRCPDYVEGINLPGWHLHFISDDGTKGGHLLDADIKKADAIIDYTSNFSMVLPETEEFAKLNLSENLSQKTQQVEGKAEK